MRRHIQKPMDGQCLRVAVASLFGIPVSKVPMTQPPSHRWDPTKKQFVGKSYDNTAQVGVLNRWLQRYGLRVEWVGSYNFGLSWDHRVPFSLMLASGGSPRFGGNHAVVWDARQEARDHERVMGRVAHDPTPAKKNRGKLRSLDGFYVFTVTDPGRLHRLHRLYPRSRQR